MQSRVNVETAYILIRNAFEGKFPTAIDKQQLRLVGMTLAWVLDFESKGSFDELMERLIEDDHAFTLHPEKDDAATRQ